MKVIKFILLFLIFVFCTAGSDYYQNTIPGVPISPGVRLGGVWKKTEPECNHDLSQLDILKQESRENAKNWRRISYISAILASISVLIWYLSKLSQAGGVAVLTLLWSVFSSFMAVLMTMTWLLVVICVVLVLIGLGIYLHKKSFFEWLKERKNDKNRTERTEN